MNTAELQSSFNTVFDMQFFLLVSETRLMPISRPVAQGLIIPEPIGSDVCLEAEATPGGSKSAASALPRRFDSSPRS